MQRVTVLRTLGPVLAKTWKADGSIGDYDLARQFRVRVLTVASLSDWHEQLRRLERDPRSCVIRGKLAKPTDAPVLRNLDTFADQANHLLLVDFDHFTPTCDPATDLAGAIREAIDTLPEAFQDASCVYQLSGSMGHPTRAGQLRLHLWFWLQRAMTCIEAEAWAMKWMPLTDHTVHRVVQVNYTSAPVLEGGQLDPYAGRRVGFIEGMTGHAVTLPASMPVPDTSELQRISHAERSALVDPRDKPGVIGALSRAFEPAQIVELFPELFEAGSKPERITWLQGGGAREGIRVTDSCTHLFNSHSTAPVQRACNLFDFVRAHVFGHLDGEDDDADFDITALPSYKATEAWALSLPEVQEQLQGPKAEAVLEAAADAKAEAALAAEPDQAERMTNLRKLIEQCPSRQKLEHDIGRRVARAKSFTDADREEVAQLLKARTAELMNGPGLPISVVRKWVQPVVPTLEHAFPDLNADGTPRCTMGNVRALLAREGITVHYDVIAKRQVITLPGVQYSLANYDNATLAHCISECARVGIPYGATTIRAFLTALADQNPFNPVQAWVDSAPWDGRSRLSELAATITHAPDFNEADKLRILRKWLIQAVAGALSPVPLQLRGVMVFQGGQNKGKSRWLESLAPRGLVITGRQLDPHNKDSVKTAVSYWLTELGELDATFRRTEISSLKAFLSNSTDTLRLPYALADSVFQRTTTFFGSVNPEVFLHDDTGNTRFWPIPIISVQPDHSVNMQQLWAEMAAAWRAGEAHYFTEGEMEAVGQASERFESSDPIGERIAVAFAWEAAARDAEAVEWKVLTATEVLTRVGVNASGASETKRAGDALRRLGARKAKRTENARGWLVPFAKSNVIEVDFAERGMTLD